MSLFTVDARGRSCPEPVLLAKQAADAGNTEIEVLVDNNTASNNVSRYLKNAGYEIELKKAGSEYTLYAKKA